MKKKILISLFIFFSWHHLASFGQSSKLIDSLTQVINSSTSEEVRASNYMILGKSLIQNDLKNAMLYVNKAIDLGYKNNLVKSIADGYSARGTIYMNMGDHRNALSSLDSALVYYQKIRNEPGVADVFGSMATVFYSIGDYTKSLEYHLMSLKKREELNDLVGQARAYNGMANIYLSQREYERALGLYKKGLEIILPANDRILEVSLLCNIGLSLAKQNKLDQAIGYYIKAVSIADSINIKDGKAMAYIGLSNIAAKKGELSEGIEYIKKAEKLYLETGNAYRINEVYAMLGNVYERMNDYKKCIEYNDLLLKKGRELGMKQFERDALDALSYCYYKLNDWKMAFQYLSEYKELNGKMFTEEKIKQAAEMQIKFETEKKEKENVLLASKIKVQSLELSNSRYLMFGLGALFILSVIIAWLVFRQNKLRFKQTSIQLKHKLLRSQMNPHFIFNSLTTIESFIYESKPKDAGRYLSDFARLMRLILENSSEEYITLSKEIKTLEYYLVLQKLRLDDHLTYTIRTDGMEDPESINIPPMLTQPFIENSIEHGFRGQTKDGHIDIEFRIIDNNRLLVRVTDNGNGINNSRVPDDKNTSQHKSMALQITKERLMVLNKSRRQKTTFSISDISDAQNLTTGTRVEFTIPVG